MIPGYPNGVTHRPRWPVSAHEHILCGGQTRGTEPSKYPQEKKSNEIPLVAASERGGAQTGGVQASMRCAAGVESACRRGIGPPRAVIKRNVSGRVWEGRPERVKAPYAKRCACVGMGLEYGGTREILPEAGGTTLQGYILGSYR